MRARGFCGFWNSQKITRKNSIELLGLILRIIALKGVDYMLRQKISIVLAPKVLSEVDAIAKTNDIRATEFMTRLVEELFIRNKKLLIDMLQDMSLDIPANFSKLVDYNEVELPYETREIVLPEKCPACGESEDILGHKVMYHSGGFIHCKACLGKFNPELR